MSKTVLTLKVQPNIPLEAELLSPDIIAPLGNKEIASFPVILESARKGSMIFFISKVMGAKLLKFTETWVG